MRHQTHTLSLPPHPLSVLPLSIWLVSRQLLLLCGCLRCRSHRITSHRLAASTQLLPVDKCNVSQTRRPVAPCLRRRDARFITHPHAHSPTPPRPPCPLGTHMLPAPLATKRHSAHFDICNLFSIDKRAGAQADSLLGRTLIIMQNMHLLYNFYLQCWHNTQKVAKVAGAGGERGTNKT